METFKLNERQIDIIRKALSMYSTACKGGGYEYTSDDVDELEEKFS